MAQPIKQEILRQENKKVINNIEQQLLINPKSGMFYIVFISYISRRRQELKRRIFKEGKEV